MTAAQAAEALARAVAPLRFAPPTTHVYNPLEYAFESHALYAERYGRAPRDVLLVGMNPGPWGMAQTGVPFGDVAMVRDWLGIEAPVGQPAHEHPKRPVQGFACPRSETSGRRIWGWARERFGTPDRFFARFFVVNYCPLCFMEESGRNRTPDKLPGGETEPLFEACDRHLLQLAQRLRPRHVVGVGAFAEKRARVALDSLDLRIGRILHPSPANPLANAGWGRQAEDGLRSMGIAL